MSMEIEPARTAYYYDLQSNILNTICLNMREVTLVMKIASSSEGAYINRNMCIRFQMLLLPKSSGPNITPDLPSSSLLFD